MGMKWGGVAIAIVVVVILGMGYFALNNTADGKEISRPLVKVAYIPVTGAHHVFIAQEYDYFGEEGLDVEFIPLQSSNQEIEALIRGDVDMVAVSSAIPVLTVEILDPGKLVIFGAQNPPIIGKPFDSIIVRPDSEITELKQLEGKKIGVFPGSTATHLLNVFLEQKGIDAQSIKFIQLAPPTQLAALESGSIDALHAYEPSVTIALVNEKARKVYGGVYAELLNNEQNTATISKRFLSEKPSVAARAIRALSRGMVYLQENEKDSRRILAKYMKLDEEVAQKVSLTYTVPYYLLNMKTEQEYADRLYELGELSQRVEVQSILYAP
jgi:ABC-type nitrate/sulfonate/bicarbonate transport system substrate-binding protein